MRTDTQQITQELQKYGQSLIGKSAQSGLLSEIGKNGQKVMSQPQKITGFEIVEVMQEPMLLINIGGVEVFEDLLINIH
jgi:hypothetical protein